MDQRQGHKGLADFIRQNEAAIIKEWVEFARTISPAGDKMSKLALEDHIVKRGLHRRRCDGEIVEALRCLLCLKLPWLVS
jgi:hypothetical protein